MNTEQWNKEVKTLVESLRREIIKGNVDVIKRQLFGVDPMTKPANPKGNS